MQLVWVRPELVVNTERHWRPFLKNIAPRARLTEDELASEIYDDLVQLHLIVDDALNVVALVGTRMLVSYGRKTGVIQFVTGTGAHHWFDLIDDLETWFRFHGCERIKTECRPGWKRMLKGKDFRETHVVMEKDL